MAAQITELLTNYGPIAAIWLARGLLAAFSGKGLVPAEVVSDPAFAGSVGLAAGATVLLAHGAGAPSDSPFQTAVAQGLAAVGIAVARFDFPYMQRARATGRRGGPDPQPRLLDCMRRAASMTASC